MEEIGLSPAKPESPHRDMTWRFQNKKDSFRFETLFVFSEKRTLPEEDSHKGVHMIRPSEQMGGYCEIDTVKTLGRDKDIAKRKKGPLNTGGETPSVLIGSGVVEPKINILIEVQTDNPGKMHNIFDDITKILWSEQSGGVWRCLIEIPERLVAIFRQIVADIPKIHTRVIEPDEARTILGEGGGALDT